MASQEFDQDFINKVQEQINGLVIARADGIVLQTHNILTLKTPVDTGQARASWNVSLNTPNFSVPPRPLKDRQGKLIFGRLPPNTARPDIPMKKMGGKYFIVNATKHIIYLNEGHSQQRPEPFIEQAVYSAVKSFD